MDKFYFQRYDCSAFSRALQVREVLVGVPISSLQMLASNARIKGSSQMLASNARLKCSLEMLAPMRIKNVTCGVCHERPQ